MRSLIRRLELLEREQAIDPELLAFWRQVTGDPQLPWNPYMARPYEDRLRDMYEMLSAEKAAPEAVAR
jgi:hypothetical protein